MKRMFHMFIKIRAYFVPSQTMRVVLLLLLIIGPLSAAQTIISAGAAPLAADTYVGTDAYKNLYFIDQMVFYKQGPDGHYEFKDFSLGSISKIDLINPLKIMVFYQQTNTVLFLDNRLNEIERINFNNLPEFINVSAVGNAGNNRLWLFNTDTQQLELYDYRVQRKTLVSQPLEGALIDLASNFNFCYLLFDDRLVSFNIYGSFLSEIEYTNGQQLAQLDENVWLVDGTELYFIAEPGLHSLQQPSTVKKIPLPEITIKQLHLTQDFLYIYDGKSLHLFSVKQPKKE